MNTNGWLPGRLARGPVSQRPQGEDLGPRRFAKAVGRTVQEAVAAQRDAKDEAKNDGIPHWGGRVTPSRFRLTFHPVDRTIAAILLIAIAVGVTPRARASAEMGILLWLHLGLLAALALFSMVAARWERATWSVFGRPLVAVAIIFTIYGSLGRLGMTAMPYRADAFLSEIDQKLFLGYDPTFLIEPHLSAARVEFFSVFYALFIPYVNLSLALGALGRPPLERDQFLTGWVFTYAFSYLGYIFLPAQGPAAFHAVEYGVSLEGGYFYRVIMRAVEDTGGMLGAFPSLHVGASLYLCLFDMRTNRLRALTYLPVVMMIYLATVVLRFHYVIDLVVGTLIGAACTRLGPWAFSRWARARQAASMPALPGGEGDVLPDLPEHVEAGASPVL